MDVKPQHIQEMKEYSDLKYNLNTGTRNVSGIAVNKSNTKIAVADRSACCVRVFNMDGDLLLSYGSEGSGNGQLKSPKGLSFLDDRDLAIVDSGNNRICIVDANSGELVATFGGPGNKDGEFNHPRGVHVDEDSSMIIVCDRGNHRVQVFTMDGDYLYQFPVPTERGPHCAIAHNGLYYVSSISGVHVIEMKDNLSPAIRTTIGGRESKYGRLQSAGGLAIDNDNNLLVCDFKSRSISKFTLDGHYIGRTDYLSDDGPQKLE
ncbi:E3 ubiquitin-protein ligase TRIM71 [Exaiptasia diaphana]|nr:E3 ubiquitin-protein ligase TRIM71 [Exaiptasia diaphana]